jgi:hypothetical protein
MDPKLEPQAHSNTELLDTTPLTEKINASPSHENRVKIRNNYPSKPNESIKSKP